MSCTSNLAVPGSGPTLADQVNQFLQFAFYPVTDALKSGGRSSRYTDAIQEQDESGYLVQSRSEAR